MAKEIELDLSKIITLTERLTDLSGREVNHAFSDISDDWVRQARDIAPIETGNLRQQIVGEVEGSGINSKVIVTANAMQKGFNYSYYIHEAESGGR